MLILIFKKKVCLFMRGKLKDMLKIENLRVLLVSLNFKGFHWFEDMNESFLLMTKLVCKTD